MRHSATDRSRSPAARRRLSKRGLVVVLAVLAAVESGCYGGRRIPVSRPIASDLPFVVTVQFSTPREVVLHALHDSTESLNILDGVAWIRGHLVATLGDSLVIQTIVIRDRGGFDYAQGIIAVVPDSASGVRATRFLPRMSYQQRRVTENAINGTTFLIYVGALLYGISQPW